MYVKYSFYLRWFDISIIMLNHEIERLFRLLD